MTHISKILIIGFLTFFNLFLGSALASDAALKRIIGFSPDGKYFTFEQYGIQDGSGWPYVDIFFIDTLSNTWVESPVRLLIKDETISISKARALAIAKATPTINRLNTTLHGFTLVSNPITQLDRNKYNAHFGLHPSAPTLNQFKLELKLQNSTSSRCVAGHNPKMFSLSLTAITGGDILLASYADTNIPNSRRCPLDYSISDIHYFEAVNGDAIFMIFLNVMSVGFEGADRRFMVIPFNIVN